MQILAPGQPRSIPAGAGKPASATSTAGRSTKLAMRRMRRMKAAHRRGGTSRRMNLKKELWTIKESAVTCRHCAFDSEEDAAQFERGVEGAEGDYFDAIEFD